MTPDAALELIADHELHSVRVVFADQHGLLKGKTIAAAAMPAAFERGIGMPGSLLHKDTGNNYAVELWRPTGDETLDALVGARNLIMRPDPATLRPLPWLPGTGIVISDLETTDGQAIAHSTRRMCQDALVKLQPHHLAYVAGLELEFHLFRVGESGRLEHSHPGWDLLGEDALDRIEPAIEPIRLGLEALGIPPLTVEAELGPSQVELTFAPARNLDIADQAVLVRAAIRQIARRNGYQASFMSRPTLDGPGFPSGWHLHQSMVATSEGSGRSDGSDQSGRSDQSGPSLFMPTDADGSAGADGAAAETIDNPVNGPSEIPTENAIHLSVLGQQVVAGLLANATASCMLTTPTVTGYKRFRPRAVTPDRISWSREHRGAMLRVIGGPGDPATRVENRAGDPAANPYLYVTSQILGALDGIEHELVPPPPTESPYDSTGGRLLPRNLGEAIEAFTTSTMYRKHLGDPIVDYLTALKQSEWQRFNAAVTDWEQHEYFEQF